MSEQLFIFLIRNNNLEIKHYRNINEDFVFIFHFKDPKYIFQYVIKYIDMVERSYASLEHYMIRKVEQSYEEHIKSLGG